MGRAKRCPQRRGYLGHTLCRVKEPLVPMRYMRCSLKGDHCSHLRRASAFTSSSSAGTCLNLHSLFKYPTPPLALTSAGVRPPLCSVLSDSPAVAADAYEATPESLRTRARRLCTAMRAGLRSSNGSLTASVAPQGRSPAVPQNRRRLEGCRQPGVHCLQQRPGLSRVHHHIYRGMNEN